MTGNELIRGIELANAREDNIRCSNDAIWIGGDPPKGLDPDYRAALEECGWFWRQDSWSREI